MQFIKSSMELTGVDSNSNVYCTKLFALNIQLGVNKPLLQKSNKCEYVENTILLPP